MTALLTEQKLLTEFSTTFDFYNALIENRPRLSNFLLYTFKRFEIGSPFDKRGEIENCLQFISQKKNDCEVFLYLRKRQEESRPTDSITPQQMKQREKEEVVTKRRMDNVNKKAKDVKDSCQKKKISYGNFSSSQIQSVLDVGTEKLEFLDALEQQFKLPRGNVKGINIEIGFCHYEESFKENSVDHRFQLYDGKNIPFSEHSFDLITMFSVIHHIPTKDFKTVAAEIYRVCNGYLYIKDVDLKDEVSAILFRIQHYLYEGVLFPGNFSYMNSTVTMVETISILESVGFELIYKTEWNNFNSTYNILLKKKEIQLPSKKRCIQEISSTNIENSTKLQKREEKKVVTGFKDILTRLFPNSSKQEFSYDKIYYISEIITNSLSTFESASRCKDWILQLKLKYFPTLPKIIVDGCAMIGNQSIAFTKTNNSFEKCVALETDSSHIDCIIHNTKLYGLTNYIECYKMDVVEWYQKEENQKQKSILFLDPLAQQPTQQKNILQIIEDLPFTTHNSIVKLVQQLLLHFQIPLIVLRLPSNFNTEQFKSENCLVEENRSNRNVILVGLINKKEIVN